MGTDIGLVVLMEVIVNIQMKAVTIQEFIYLHYLKSILCKEEIS